MIVAVAVPDLVIVTGKAEEEVAVRATDVPVKVLSGAVVGTVKESNWLAFSTVSSAEIVPDAKPPSAD